MTQPSQQHGVHHRRDDLVCPDSRNTGSGEGVEGDAAGALADDLRKVDLLDDVVRNLQHRNPIDHGVKVGLSDDLVDIHSVDHDLRYVDLV